MEILERFNNLIERLQSTSGRIDKENILSEYKDDDEVKYLFDFIYNPYIVTGISKKKLSKYKDVSIDGTNLFTLTMKTFKLFDFFNYFKDHNTGRDSDLQYLEWYSNMYQPEYKDLIYSIISKDIKTGVQPTTLNKIYGDTFIPKFDVMLAQKYFDNPDKLVPEGTQFILTTKLDGVRCVLINKETGPEFFSRQGQLFEGLEELEEEAQKLPKGYAYDGELLLNKQGLESKDLYRETMKVVSSDKKKVNVIFNCFDILPIEDFQKGICETPCYQRKEKIHETLAGFNTPHFREVQMLYLGDNKDRIQEYLDQLTSKGEEGVMINIASAPYECKRSKNLLKVKKFNTCDVRVVGLEEGTGQNVGKLGAINIEFIGPDNKIYPCSVGSGLSQEQRIDFWEHKEKLLGKIIEVKYFEISNNQNGTYGLRFPIFKWIREDKDEISMY